MFPKNSGSTKKIVVEDKLHLAALDYLFLDLARPHMVQLNGITKKDNRWTLANGTHNINYGNDASNKSCYLRVNCEKDIYVIEFTGDEPTKTVGKVLNAKRIEITNNSLIREIDLLIMKEKSLAVNGGFTVDIVSIPMNNIYAINKPNEHGYIILQKQSDNDHQSYNIDIVGDYYNGIITNILNGNADRIRVLNCSVINEHIYVRFMDKIPFQIMYPCQQTIIDDIISTYTTNANKNVSILITGPPNMGKSSVALGIIQIMKRQLAIDPYLIKGFNINCEEIQYHPIINQYAPKYEAPVILLLDEFDIAMNNANLQNNKRAHAISANKTNLNNFLDSVNDEQFLITVATTNLPIQEIQLNYGVYCRKGRFNKYYEIKSKDIVNIVEPT